MNTLFEWFNSKIAATYQTTQCHSARPVLRSLGEEESRRIHLKDSSDPLSPAETLRRLGAPAELANIFTSLTDCEIILKTAGDGAVPDLERREKKRKRSTGQFYTPEALAERLVAIADPAPDGDILDPACGDGSFLMAMAGELAKKASYPQITQMAEDEDKCHWSVCFRPDAHRHSPIHGLREETSSTTCPPKPWRRRKQSLAHSVIARSEATKQSSGETSFLSRLHGFDIDLQALFVCLTRLICAFPGCGWPVLEHRDFLMNPPDRRYSVVIGNPPYRVNLDEAFKLRLAELYETGEGEKDLYTFFIEGSLKALQPGGRLLMLTSHTYLVNHQCNRIRHFIFAGHHARALLLLPARFFVLAPGVLPVILVADAESPPDGSQLSVYTGYNEKGGWEQCYQAPARLFEQSNGLRQAIVPPQLQQVFADMNSCVRLGSLCRVGVGIQEALKRDGKVSRFVSDKKLSASYKRVLRGRELEPFKINWEGNYIDYGPHLAYAGDETVFAGPKILYQNIRNERLKIRLVAALDNEGFFPKNSLSYILSESKDFSAWFVLGLLNSLLVNAWFSGNFHSFHITVTQVRQIPLPTCSEALRQKIAELSELLSRTVARTGKWQKTYEQLNLLVCESYLGVGDHKQLLTICDNFLDQAAAL
ncbi:MAG: N-6 DNA methylase [Candidatus Riflebacteria bacterium]|nr:N-6 DNA methylase [Candidatus Riflebacteria bacterium]